MPSNANNAKIIAEAIRHFPRLERATITHEIKRELGQYNLLFAKLHTRQAPPYRVVTVTADDGTETGLTWAKAIEGQP